MIDLQWENDLYRFITSEAPRWQGRVLAINGMPDHIHIVTTLAPSANIAEFISRVKGSSSHFINHRILTESLFAWQGEYSAHTISERALANVMQYIRNQKQHHSDSSTLADLEQW